MSNIKAMEVVCIKERPNDPKTSEGLHYFVDRDSIYMDCDGTAYGDFFDGLGKYLGHYDLSRFQTVRPYYDLRRS